MLGELKQLAETHTGPPVGPRWAFSGGVMAGSHSTGIAVAAFNLRASARSSAAEAALSHLD